MQPQAQNASYGPTRPLEFGQINFLHTTDTHGWLEGHIKEKNYGAGMTLTIRISSIVLTLCFIDWGDFVSFTRHMKQKASQLNVDLLLVDTGDLHDGESLPAFFQKGVKY